MKGLPTENTSSRAAATRVVIPLVAAFLPLRYTMKTLIIWSDFEDFPKLFLLDGDYRHLNDTILNTSVGGLAQRELDKLMHCPDTGEFLHKAIDDPWPLHISSIVDAAYVIRCGISP